MSACYTVDTQSLLTESKKGRINKGKKYAQYDPCDRKLPSAVQTKCSDACMTSEESQENFKNIHNSSCCFLTYLKNFIVRNTSIFNFFKCSHSISPYIQ
jgi:hypothetical protein